MDVVYFNGQFINVKDLSISVKSRAFNYGDGFFESVKIINSKVFNFFHHYKRIKLAFGVLKLKDIHSLDFFEDKLCQLIKLNKIDYGSLKIHFIRSGSGKYSPVTNNADLLITSNHGYQFIHNDPISLCFYDSEFKSTGHLSNIKSMNSLIYVLASMYAKENNYNNAIIFNTNSDVIEVSNANIFIVRDNIIFTPKIECGCVDGTMRGWVCKNFDVVQKVILKDDVLNADEVFITNATNGATSVRCINNIAFSSFKVSCVVQNKLINLSSGF